MQNAQPIHSNSTFHDFYSYWLFEIMKDEVSENTWNGYWLIARVHLLPYFSDHTINTISKEDIMQYYDDKLESGLSKNTLRHHHANLTKAFSWALDQGLITINPAYKANRNILARGKHFVGNYLTPSELQECFQLFQGTKLELPVLLGGLLGLRRSEICGLSWDCIDFHARSIEIRQVYVDTINQAGQSKCLYKPTTKSESSHRTLPLSDFLIHKLRCWKQQQVFWQSKHADTYCQDHRGFVFLHENGDLITPHYISGTFSKILKRNHFKHIRFHDLRHSCATIMMEDLHCDLPDIQSWLGHSDLSTTAIYLHTRMDVMRKMANNMEMLIKA